MYFRRRGDGVISTTMTMSYVKHDEDEPRQGQGKQSGGWLISNMTKRMTTRTQQGLGPGKCDGSVGEDKLRKQHGQNLWGGGVTVGD